MRTLRRPDVVISLLLIAACVFLGAVGLSGRAPASFQSLEIYSGQRGAVDPEAVSRLARARAAQPRLASGLVAKLGVSLRSERLPALVDAVELPWKSPRLDESSSGWTRQDDRWVWFPGARRETLGVPFFAPDPRNSPRLADFDELWIDYQNLSSRNSCVPAPEMMLRSGGAVVAFNAPASSDLETIDVVGARWSKKTYGYAIGRMLGLPPDEDWRYTQFGRFTVLQRRLHEDLSNLAEVALVFQNDAPVVHVNLRVKFGDSPGFAELFQLGETATRVGADGRSAAHIDMKKVLGSRLSDPRAKAYLEEITVFVRGEQEKVAKERPLREINLYHGSLPGRIDKIAPFRDRFVLDLRALSGSKSGVFSWGKIGFSAYDPDSVCAVKLDNVRLVSFFDKARPVFLREGEELARRWGGPFAVALGSGTRVEWPRVQGYLPFQSARPGGEELLFDERKIIVTIDVERHQARLEAKTAFKPEPFTVKPAADRRLIQGVGYKVRSDDAFTGAVLAQDGLVLEGYGKRVEFDWPISARLDQASRFFAALAEGGESIAKGALTLELQSGGSRTLDVVPNQPVLLDAGTGSIKAARLRLDLNRSPYRLKLKELALFSPGLLTENEAFDEKWPTSNPISRRLHPEITVPAQKKWLRVVSGRVLGLAPQNAGRAHTLDWTTRIGGDADWARGVRFTYQVPRTLQDDDACWMNLAIRWDRRTVSRDVCFTRSRGSVLLPLGRFLDAKDDLAAFGAMRSIAWKVRLGRRALMGGDVAFAFGVELEGAGARSIRQDLQDWNALGIAGDASAWKPDGRLLGDIVKRPLRLVEDGEALEKILAGRIAPAEHPYFRLDSVAVEPRAPLSAEAWQKIVGAGGGKRSGSLRGPLILGGLLVLMGLGWSAFRGGWRSFRGANFDAGGGHRVLFAAAFLAAAVLYAKGARAPVDAAENMLFTLGGLAAVGALRGLIGSLAPWLKPRFPRLAYSVEGGGAPYFTSALIGVAATAALAVSSNSAAANQAAIVACYCLAVGVGKELFSLGKKRA
ncbi:MAG: hypothetical protein A2V88_07140 [Elusimicrobia bacterium RBG_16_66_12]|nr:MAG: hypothetical protein A2V88_07140 [Elusimicrobia bacterium RBG_16_66_12]